jgi:hypothetical protein
LTSLANKPHSATSNIFSKLDRHYLAQFGEKKEMVRQYRDIPMGLSNLYAGGQHSDYIKDRHANDLMITIENTLHTATSG